MKDGRSTLGLFGRGFVLLVLGNDPAAASELEIAAERARVPLRVIALDEPHIASLYERRFVLVRPDGQVAWRGDALPENYAWLVDTIRGARAGH
ncbi:MAG TPA: hypothetical protein VNO35_14730 [Steroidobacteraceae bacterium]|nr:hypothetical protein [Steroidobacteraceae bacterium]